MLRGNTIIGAEQAAANYLIRENLLPMMKILESNVADGAVLTNGLVQTDIRNENILNLSKNVPAVVHQYNRHNNMVQLVNKIYRSDKLITDCNNEDLIGNFDIINVLIRQKHFDEALEKFIQLINSQSSAASWQKLSFRRINKLFDHIFSLKQKNFNLELLVQCICNILFIQNLNKNVTPIQAENLYNMLLMIEKNKYTIYQPFKDLVGALIWQFANFLANNNDIKNSIINLERLKQIDYPLDSKYYLLSAKNNRLLKNLDKALEDYKKALGKN